MQIMFRPRSWEELRNSFAAMIKWINWACHRRVFEMPVTEALWLIKRSETVCSEVDRCPPFELVAVTLGYQLHTHTHTHTHIQGWTYRQPDSHQCGKPVPHCTFCVCEISPFKVRCSVKTQENEFVTHGDSTGWRYIYAVCYIYYHNNAVLPAY